MPKSVAGAAIINAKPTHGPQSWRNQVMASKFIPKIEAIKVGGTKAMVASESAFSTLVCAALMRPSIASCR